MILLDDTEECYRFNRTIDYEYDVELFLKEIAKAKTETDRNEQAMAYRAATRLYRGPYLPEVQGIWILPERERLQQNYLEAVLKLAEFHLEIHEYNVALEYCRRALAEDVCLEEAHRLAMRTHAALGNQAAVVRQFERCQQILLDKVNASPSPQTKALYETLVY
jgi:two-component SAPR family response regulator